MKQILSKFIFNLVLFAGFARATNYTYVTIPANNNIETGLISSIPEGVLIANGTPFNISSEPRTCGPSRASSCNFYDGFGFSGSGKSITMDVSIESPTEVYTLMNAYMPAAGQELATIEFVGTGGASVKFSLIGGKNIRDFYHSGFANGLTNGIAGMTAMNAFSCRSPGNCKGGGGTGKVATGAAGTYVIDEQEFSLGSAFEGQTLTRIILTDTRNGSDPILLGATVGAAGPATQNGSPGSSLLFALRGANVRGARHSLRLIGK